MIETLRPYGTSDHPPRPQHQPPPSFEVQLKALPPSVRSVAESLAMRDMEGAKRYVLQFLAANRGMRS